MYQLINRIQSRQEGQGVLEFAIVIPLVLILLLGILEFGWILNAKITLTSAAREAARVAAVSTTLHRERAYIAAETAVTGTSGITLSDNSDDFIWSTQELIADNTRNVIIEIKGYVKPIVGLFVDDPFVIKARATMRIE